MNGPLQGLRVVDFTKFLPGPYCTWMLADLGAEVIRIENPREVAKFAKVFGWDKLSEEEIALRRARDIFTRSKQSVLLNPGDEKAREAIHELVRSADILVEDYRPGVMESMGYGYDTMKSINERLIYCSVTLCGQTGPYSRKPGHDPVALAIAGTLSRLGENLDRPSFVGVPVADILSGSNAVIGVLSAVIARGQTGRGQRVDIAMSDSAMVLIAGEISRNKDLTKRSPRTIDRADCGIWQTQDGLFIVTTDMEPRYWKAFCDAIGRPDLTSRQMDVAHWPGIKAEIASVMQTKTQSEWLAIFDGAGTQFAPVLSIPEALQNEHNRARDMVLDIPLSSGESVTHIGSPIHLSDTPVVSPTPGRPAGADTRAVLASLGYEPKQIEDLLEDTSP